MKDFPFDFKLLNVEIQSRGMPKVSEKMKREVDLAVTMYICDLVVIVEGMWF